MYKEQFHDVTSAREIPEDWPKEVVNYESIKRKLNRRLIYGSRCDERLKAKDEGSTRLSYTGWNGGLEHL